MKVLVLEQTNELAELLGIYLAALSASEVVALHLTQEAVHAMEGTSFDIFFCGLSYTAPGADLALKTWQRLRPEAPVVMLGDGVVPDELKSSHRVGHLHLVQELKELVKSPFWRKLEGRPAEHPLPLSPYLVYRLGICPADLFLKLGDANWVKLFHKGSPFGEQERAKFEAKGLKEFWVLPEDITQALGHFEDLLSSLTQDLAGNEALVADSTELIWHVVHEEGFREEVQKVVKAAVQQALVISKNNPELKAYLDRMLRSEHGHLVRHSMITAHIACAIAAQLGWTSDQTYLKLTFAALMHDMMLPKLDSSEDVWLDVLAGESSKDMKTQPEFRTFLQHPVEGSQLLRRFKDIPPDTDKIVLEHHELPEGKGFPRGLSASQISPLGCLFILAHHSAEVLLRFHAEKKPWGLLQVLVELRPERWQTGNFKKIWQTMEKTSLFS